MKEANHKEDIEHIQKRVLGLISQCIDDIQDTVESSGLNMRDVGVGIEKYKTNTGTDIIELRVSHKKIVF